MAIDLSIISDGGIIYPCVEDGSIIWETERKGTPGVLKFTVIKTDDIYFTEGDTVRLVVDGQKVFLGYVFKKKRDKQHFIDVTAYDQLRYLKNKDTYVYYNKTAGDVLEMIASDFKLSVGSVESSGYVIKQKVENNQTLFDIIQNAMDDTLVHTKKLYVLYDDFGSLCFQNIESMQTDVLIDASTGENFNYESSIDDRTYDQIKLVYENEKTGKREVYMTKDSNNIDKWGILQYYEVAKSDQGLIEKAEALLNLYNTKTRKLKIEKAVGVPSVRAGSSVFIMLDLGDITVQNMMVCEKVSHTFANDYHTMDLTLRDGKEFIA